MLNGQKLQGVETAREIHLFLKARGTDPKEYPLFDVVVSRLDLAFWFLLLFCYGGGSEADFLMGVTFAVSDRV